MNPNYEQNLGQGPEVVLPVTPAPAERGSEKWSFGGLVRNVARVGLKWGLPAGIVSSIIVIGGVNFLNSQTILFPKAFDLEDAVKFSFAWTAIHFFVFSLAGYIDYVNGERHL